MRRNEGSSHQVEPDPEGKPSDVTIVTLLLSPEDTERAVLASNQGAIHFVLRNGNDARNAGAPPLMLSELTAATISAPHLMAKTIQPRVLVAAKPREPEIETVLGGAR